MAYAKKQEKVVEVRKTYILTLDENEAQALYDVLAKVGGDRDYSRRKFIDSIYTCLFETGLRHNLQDMQDSCVFFCKR